MTAPKLSNLDCTRRAVVKRGCVVQFPGGATARVARVRAGHFWTECRYLPIGCALVKVIST